MSWWCFTGAACKEPRLNAGISACERRSVWQQAERGTCILWFLFFQLEPDMSQISWEYFVPWPHLHVFKNHYWALGDVPWMLEASLLLRRSQLDRLADGISFSCSISACQKSKQWQEAGTDSMASFILVGVILQLYLSGPIFKAFLCAGFLALPADSASEFLSKATFHCCPERLSPCACCFLKDSMAFFYSTLHCKLTGYSKFWLAPLPTLWFTLWHFCNHSNPWCFRQSCRRLKHFVLPVACGIS